MLMRILATVAGYTAGQIVNLDPREAAQLVQAGTAERAVTATAQAAYDRDNQVAQRQHRAVRPYRRGGR